MAGFAWDQPAVWGVKLSTHPDMLHLSQDVSLTWLPLETTNVGLPFARPETIESLFIVYRLTGHPQYHEWAWNSFLSITNNAEYRVAGDPGTKNVNVTLEPHPPVPSIAMEWAEVKRAQMQRERNGE